MSAHCVSSRIKPIHLMVLSLAKFSLNIKYFDSNIYIFLLGPNIIVWHRPINFFTHKMGAMTSPSSSVACFYGKIVSGTKKHMVTDACGFVCQTVVLIICAMLTIWTLFPESLDVKYKIRCQGITSLKARSTLQGSTTYQAGLTYHVS